MTREDAEHIAAFVLSKAERRVLVLMLEGLSAKEIGNRLQRSFFTVNNHTRKIFEAYSVRSRAQIMTIFVVPPEL